jgi:hypothetical protein
MSELGVDFTKLRTAVDWSIRQLETPRKKRVEAITQYVGNHYSDSGSEFRVPTNFLELAITIYARQLAARAPQAIVAAKQPYLKRQAYEMELAINQVPGEINLGETIRSAVLEALFSFAVVKVGLCSSGACVLGHEYGEPFCDLVPFDDYFCDMGAKTRASMQFEGNDYWLPVDDARKMFNTEKIEPDQHTTVGDQGQKRAESISVSEGATILRDMVWVRDVWIPSTRKVATYSVKGLKLLNVVEWKGPDRGPYHRLGFSTVPGNLLPLPPVALWRDLHELGNSIFRKLARQAEAKKTVAAFAGGNDDDVENLKRSADGDGIKYSGSRPEAITVGGIDAPSLAFYLQVRDLFSYFAGNLDSLGGLSATASTLGQDKLLSEAASARLNDMAESTSDFVREIFRDLAFYEWNDPVKERDIVKSLDEAPEFTVQAKWSPETRKGRFQDYDFDIDVFSMQDDSPSVKIQKLGTTLERFIFPLLPFVTQQGGQVDLKKLVEVLAKYGNIPELAEVVKFVDPASMMQGEGQGGGDGVQKPSNTTRTYVRENRSAPTRAGKDDVMSRLLMGGKVPSAEGASLGRIA